MKPQPILKTISTN
jgi:hypothetical protein